MDLDSQQQNDQTKRLHVIAAWVVLFLVCVFSYWPGLNGPFVFDDIGSIADLGKFGGVKDWETFKAFVFGGTAGPTGRPLAMLSFLLDANNWPTDSWPFKRTNLIIHLLSGAVLGALITRILNLLGHNRQDARWIGLLSAACWLLHPFLVSTTLYVVQRMAQLSTFFIFSGLLTYLYGRSLIVSNTRKAYLCMSLSVVLFTFLAMISKENGILLPLLIGVVEITICSNRQSRLSAPNRYWSIGFIVAPSAMIAAYLGRAFFSEYFFEIAPHRDFSLYERLLTEPRVIVDYLRHWFVPDPYTAGVFQDHFVKSTSILSPVSTLLSVLLHLSVISIALYKRHQWRLFGFAILFFYSSHLLESTVINLELYFEHRNYLAAAFLFVPLLVFINEKVNRGVFFAITTGALIVLAGCTRYSATIWQDYPSMVEAAARKAPTSVHAQAQYATNLHNEMRYEESVQVIDRAIEVRPRSATLLITRSVILCNTGVLEASDFDKTARVLSTKTYDLRLLEYFTTLSSLVADRRCPDVTLAALRAMFENMLLSAGNRDPRSRQYSQINYFIGFVDVRSGALSAAVAAFEESLRALPEVSHTMQIAALLASNGYAKQALHFSNVALQQLEQTGTGFLPGASVSESDIKQFRATVESDIESARDEVRDGPTSEQ